MALGRPQSDLGASVPATRDGTIQEFESGSTRGPTADFGRLVEASGGVPEWMQWNGNDHVHLLVEPALQDARPQQAAEYPPDCQLAPVLERLYETIHRKRIFERRKTARVRWRPREAMPAERARVWPVPTGHSAARAGRVQGRQTCLAVDADVEAGPLAWPAAQDAAWRQQQAADAIENVVNRHGHFWLTVGGGPRNTARRPSPPSIPLSRPGGTLHSCRKPQVSR